MDAVAKFGIQHVVLGRRHTLVLAGELDVDSVAMLEGSLAHIRLLADTKLVLDLRGLSLIDDVGTSAVLVAHEHCAKHGAEFALIQGPPQVRRVFEGCGLLDRLRFRDDDGYGFDSPSAGAKTDPDWLLQRASRAPA
jgi:anti-anti-sigma factor